MVEAGRGPWRSFCPQHPFSTRPPRAGCPGLGPDNFWRSPRTGTVHLSFAPHHKIFIDIDKIPNVLCLPQALLVLSLSFSPRRDGALESPVHGRLWHFGARPEDTSKMIRRMELLLWAEADRVGITLPGEEKLPGRSYWGFVISKEGL